MSTSIPFYICLSYRRSTIVWHRSLNKQRLIKETNISKHLHHKTPLIWYSKSDRTRSLYHAEPPLRNVEMYTKVTRSAVCTTQHRYYGTLKCTGKWHDPLSAPRSTATTARWNVHESDTIRRLYHAAPLLRNVEMYTKVTRSAVCTTQHRYYGALKCTEKWHDPPLFPRRAVGRPQARCHVACILQCGLHILDTFLSTINWRIYQA